MSKFALIIANTEYQDKKFEKLTAPGKDAEEFGQVLRDLAGFDVQVLLNKDEAQTSRTISRFCRERARDELSLVYFSGHGLRNDEGQLFLATTDTDIELLDPTSISADFVTKAMNSSRSQRQILILDCCNSGAFGYGRKSTSALGTSMGMATAFQGNGIGRVVLTATDATQYAWEGEKVIGLHTQKSVFTHFLIEGLKGDADRNGDGRIDIDELYDYTYEHVGRSNPKQTPKKWSYQQAGEIILRGNIKPREVKPAPLPPELNDMLSQNSSSIRWAGVQDLIRLLDGQHPGLARAAQEKLQEISKTDDSTRLRELASNALSAREQLPSRTAPPGKKPEQLSNKRGYGLAGIAGGFLAISVLVLIGWMIYNNLTNTPGPTSTPEPTEPAATAVVITDTSLPPSEVPVIITPSPEPIVGEDNMPLVLIPAGEFPMGSIGNAPDERPVHIVYLNDYFMDQTEVTNAMYAACVASGKCEKPRFITSNTQNAAINSYYYGNPKFDNYPVIFVSWEDAKTYCKWAGRRLSTEAEWEKAASWDAATVTKRLYPWGNSIDCSYANYYGKGSDLCVGDTTPVGDYPQGASSYGVLNMAGNVSEWVMDRFDPLYYGNSSEENPRGPASGDYIVIRGGSFLVGKDSLRTTERDMRTPDYASKSIGFRCAMDAP
jgi:formylglycine-generating enzyme required for sulfatase activity